MLLTNKIKVSLSSLIWLTLVTAKVIQTEDEGETSIFNKEESYYTITKPYEVAELTSTILNSQPPPILGVDCEGLTKGRPLSLI